jgi:hypothetical protein
MGMAASMRRSFLLIPVAVALVWCGASAATLRSGAYGTVTRGPITPVCSAEQPCSGPATGAVLTFFKGGQQSAKVTVGNAGAYRIRLAPGLYTVRSSMRRLTPVTVRISPGRMTKVDFSIDTGIR